jgi:hypothetical protein
MPAAARQEAHLRLLSSSWAAANGLSSPSRSAAVSPSAEGTALVWSSSRPAGTATTRSVPGPDSFHPAGPQAASASMSLTRRGRLLLVGLPIALGVIALILLGAFLTSQARAGEASPSSTATVEVSVVPGETLWDLAVQHAPERDPRDVVAEMVELNNLHSSLVQAGQRVSVPSEG